MTVDDTSSALQKRIEARITALRKRYGYDVVKSGGHYDYDMQLESALRELGWVWKVLVETEEP